MTIPGNSASLLSNRGFLSRWLSILMILGGGWFYPGQVARGAEATATKLVISAAAEIGDTVADLLTVELGALPGVVMLERESLARIAAEQKLASGSSQSLVKLGALLGADGIVVIEGRKLATRTYLDLRIVSVQHGVALGWWNYEMAESQASTWAKEAAGQLHRFVPRLSRSTRDSAPISFVGFRSSSTSRSGTEFERLVNSLLLNRLRAESDLLVLERQKLLDAAFEKSLNSDDRKFWNGAYLLDGSLNPERIEREAITLRARLVSPGDSSPLLLEVRGSRTNLSAFASDLVAEVRRALQTKPSTVVWEANAEAHGFYVEAERAARWGFWPEARAAVDTALALGKDDPETRRLRLRVYTGLIKTDPGESIWRTYKPVFGVLEAYTVPPKPGVLQDALDAGSQLQELVKSTEYKAIDPVKPLVEDALREIGKLCLKFYLGAELRTGHEELLGQLRGKMREVVNALLEHRDAAESTVTLIGKFGPLWCETPEEGVRLHQRLRSFQAYFHFWFEILRMEDDVSRTQSDWAPRLCGWKWNDRSRADELWDAYRRTPWSSAKQSQPESSRASRVRPPEKFGPDDLPSYLSQCLSNQVLPELSLLANAQRLSSTATKKQALELIKALQQLPGRIEDVHIKAGLRFEQGRLQMEIMNSEGAPPDGFDVLRQPSNLQLAKLSNVEGLPGFSREPRRLPKITAGFFSLPNAPNHNPCRLVWAQNRLWVYSKASYYVKSGNGNSFGSGLRTDYWVTAFDAAGRSESYQVPERFLGWHDRGGPAFTFFAGHDKNGELLAVVSNHVWVVLENAILILNLQDKTWSRAPSPLAAARPFTLENEAFLFNEQSVLKVSHDLKQVRVLASVQRRPPMTALDELAEFRNPRLFKAGGRLYFSFEGGVYTYREGKWEMIPGSEGSISSNGDQSLTVRFSDEALIRTEVRLDAMHTAYRGFYFGTNSEPALWWSAVSKRARATDFARESERELVQYPLVPLAEPFYYLSGRFAGHEHSVAFPFSGQLLTFTMPSNPDSDGVLRFWAANSSVPIEASVSFPGRTRWLKLEVLPAGERVFFWDLGNSNIWYLKPESELRSVDQITSPEEQQAARISQRLYSKLVAHDRNHNGRLDPDEYLALAEDPALCELVWNEVDKNHDESIRGFEVRFFDFNKNERLEEVERRAFINMVSYYACALYPALDKDRDGLLSEPEINNFCSVHLLHHPGVFRRYDKTKTGKLALESWAALVIELMDRRLSADFDGATVLSPAGRIEFLEAVVLERYFANPLQMPK
jgi:hypothetical protein